MAIKVKDKDIKVAIIKKKKITGTYSQRLRTFLMGQSFESLFFLCGPLRISADAET